MANDSFSVEDPIRTEGKRKTKKNGRGLFVAALAVFSLSFSVLCVAFVYLDSKGIIPKELFGKILIGAAAFILFEVLLLLLSERKKLFAVISILICLAVISASVYGIYVLYKVYESMQEVEDPKVYFAHVGVYVIQGSRFSPYMSQPEDGTEPILMPGDSLDGCTVGTMLTNYDRGYSSQAMRLFRRENDVDVRTYDEFGDLIDALRNGEIDAIIYNQAQMRLYLGNETDFFQWAEEVYDIGVETENTAQVRKADVVSEPFIVYLSGLDTWDMDEFFRDSRSDANLLACVDPVNKKILIVNTPRDYYVPLFGRSYAMDKLTHAGVYDIDGSLSTLESFYDIKINYYVRTNVFSLVKIVDALGGITVNSDHEFYAANGIGGFHQFYEGPNEVDGQGALCFIRERQSFDDNDRSRGRHQQECIRAIIEKACSPAIVAHFSNVLDAVTSCVRTNMGKEEINALVRMQLSDMASWSIEMYAVDGEDYYAPSYALGGREVYVVRPDYDTVEEAKQKITELMGQKSETRTD